jgi:hypothetical protein
VTIAENNISQVALAGALGNSGNTDAFGRVTASIPATTANTNLTVWPSDYVIYAVNPQTFYIMSSDSYATNSLVTGMAMQQNLADIAATPFSPTQPIVLYGNIISTTAYNSSKGPNGQTRTELQLLNVTPTSATAGSVAGSQWVNPSGTYSTSLTPGTVGSFTYTVGSNGRVTTSTSGEPLLYLADTSTGFGTNFWTANSTSAGLFYFQPQTSTTLNPGNYTYSVFNAVSQLGPMETGVINIPSTVTADGTQYPITGYDYTAFSETTIVLTPPQSILYGGAISGTIQETGGVFDRNNIILPQAIQGCGDVPGASNTPGGGFVISPTSFICVPSGSSYGQIHLFQQ